MSWNRFIKISRKVCGLKVISAVRHSGKTHWSSQLDFYDCDDIIAESIGWPLHFDKKENTMSAKTFECQDTDEHEVAKKFSEISWQLLKEWGTDNNHILAIPEVWSARSFWEWNVKPDVLVTIDESRHQQNLLELGKGHEWNTIKFWRHMLKHEAEENNIPTVNTFQEATELLR
jgi:hypothetical protein